MATVQQIRRSIVDCIIAIFAFPAGLLLRRARRAWRYMPLTRKVLRAAGVFPLREHYYEPVVYPDYLRQPLTEPRKIPGLDFNEQGQIEFLRTIRYGGELEQIPRHRDKNAPMSFCYYNGSFEGGDAEFLYSMIRRSKPKRMIEVGSGHSTLMARLAIERNKAEDAAYNCHHLCIEPYNQPWLEETGAEILRKRVELCDLTLFDDLEGGDILFIDSSHVIRAQGDVLYEVLEVLGRLKPGVFVHIHDIFTPRDYLEKWVLDDQRFWNEQYLIEAFLAYNSTFKIVAALNFLACDHRQELAEACPIFGSDPNVVPKSLWIVRT